ncbi:MAG: hypothetical protein ACKO3G_12375, partial [Planctomycetaceae bacterium]
MHDLAAILGAILDGYILPVDGFHGVVHWARVLENGLRIAEDNGADREVVTLFALFHDSRRVNEGRDDGHGLRGGELARSLRGKLIHLDDDRFDLLAERQRLLAPSTRRFGRIRANHVASWRAISTATECRKQTISKCGMA